ncbi:hypothetical protein ES332_A02G111300v1 [Gossypium tomentosum]|uniref:Uncharacterized protein n=1 Tax=Gossypium tomentosum TaxID=34277 RepID=A0A5D2RFU3_GOSTO|nr:hypothetical protein ES332_A02G111300v1 [Gossypium tomentosum]
MFLSIRDTTPSHARIFHRFMNRAILENLPLVLLSVLKSNFTTLPIMLPIASRIILLYINPGNPGSLIHAITTLGYG